LKILWVKVGALWPVDRGGRRRSFEILRELAQRHQVTLATTHGADEDPTGIRHAVPLDELVSMPWDIPKQGTPGFVAALARSWPSELPVDLWRCRVPALAADVTRRLDTGAYDVCIADFLAAAPNVPLAGRTPVVMFAHNVEHQIWQRLASIERRPVRRALLEVEWRKMRRYESQVVARVRRTIAVSEKDRQTLVDRAPAADVRAVPTGVDPAYFKPNGCVKLPTEIVFVGAMDWYPNEDGVAHFVESILPQVRREVPDAHVTVVGRNPSARIRALEPAVQVTGTVDDVRPFLDQAAVVVVPLRVGGGTRLKIFEALSMAKPVVSTTVGAEGLPLEPDEHVVLADEPDAFARAVVALLRDPQRRMALGTAGRRLVETEYGWATVARSFERQLEEVVHASHAS
jgi:glycosyltransferase involved in cell wall biosynthesis